MSDQQQRENRRRLVEPANIPNRFECAFFKTTAGPGATPYPSNPASIYYGVFLKNVSYTETPGNGNLTKTETSNRGYVFNMERAKYIEEDSIIWAFKMGAQWYTIDKVTDAFITHRKYDVNGNELWNADHGATVFDIVADSSGSVYVVGAEADDGAYIRRYNSDGTLSLSIPRGDHVIGGNGAGIAVDSTGSILVTGVTTVRKYNSSGVQQWESSYAGDTYGIAIGDSDSYYTIGGDLAKYDSTGLFIRYAAETLHDSGGGFSDQGKVVSRISENTVMDASSSRWSADLTTEFSTYRTGGCIGIDYSGSSMWYTMDSGNSASKASIVFGFPTSSLVYDWTVPQRGTGVIDYDIALFDSGNTKVMVAGDRHSSVSHQARDSADGSLLWERDHGGNLWACFGAADAAYVCGERVPA